MPARTRLYNHHCAHLWRRRCATVRLGQYVQAGTQLTALGAAAREVYIMANFKETQLKSVGAPAIRVRVRVDTFPGTYIACLRR